MIRLQRVGRKHETAFRVVVVDSRRGTKSGRTLETVGSYDPRRGKPVLKTERIKYWLSVGTQASGTVHNLLVDAKILDKTKVNVLPKRKPKAKVEKPKVEETQPKAGPPLAENSESAIIEPAVPVEPLPV